MTTLALGDRTLTDLDHARLAGLLRRGHVPDAQASPLAELLDTAEVVAPRAVDPDVVTLYSQVLLRDVADGTSRKFTVCYPADAEPEAGFVSVLSPVGAALLGRRVGQTVHWRTPSGDARHAEIVAVLFQPEASGDYTT